MLKPKSSARMTASPSTDRISHGWHRRRWIEAALASLAAVPLSACGGDGSPPSESPASSGSSDSGPSVRPSITPADAAAWTITRGLVGAAVGWLEGTAAPQPQATLAVRGSRSIGGEAIRASDDWYFGSNGRP